MPVVFQWMDEERTIALTTMSGEWTWDEFSIVSEQYHNDLRAIEHTVYEIILMDQMARNWLPPNAISYGRRLLKDQPNNVALTVTVTRNALIRNIVNMLLKLTKSTYPIHIVGAMEEATTIIERKKHNPVTP